MKQLLLTLILLIPISTQAQDRLSYKVGKIICSKNYHQCDKFNEQQFYDLGELLDQASIKYRVSFYKLLALIAIESGFDPNHIYHNTNGSYDIGLMQSNSSHTYERCMKLLNRNCRKDELLDPVISIKLAFYRFDECSKYPNDAFFICYNNNDLARRYLTSDFYPQYLEKLYVEYEIIENILKED